MLATDYSGLQMTTQIQQTDRYQICRWVYGTMTSVEMFTPTFPCINRTEGNFDLICVKTNNHITTSLIVQFPISSSVLVRAECQKSDLSVTELSSITINVKGDTCFCKTYFMLKITLQQVLFNLIKISYHKHRMQFCDRVGS